MNAMNSYARPASGLGMPARTRHAVTSDEVEAGHGHSDALGQRYSEQSAESVVAMDKQGSSLQQPFIEMSTLESGSPGRHGNHVLQKAVSEASLHIESPVWVAEAEDLPSSPQHLSAPQQHAHRLSQGQAPLLQQSSAMQQSLASQQDALLTETGVNDDYGQWESTAGVEDNNDDPHTRLL